MHMYTLIVDFFSEDVSFVVCGSSLHTLEELEDTGMLTLTDLLDSGILILSILDHKSPF